MSGQLPRIPAYRFQQVLLDVCKAGAGPMLSLNPIMAGVLQQKTPVGGSGPIDAITQQVLLTALMSVKSKQPAVSREPKLGPVTLDSLLTTKIAVFNAKTAAEQIDFISEIWKRLVDSVIPTVQAQAMVDRAGGVADMIEPLPSSLAPANPNVSPVTLTRRSADNAWTKFSFGFRVEGGKKADGDDMPRIIRDGVQPLFINRGLLRAVRQMAVDGTHVEQLDRAFIWWENRDILNESATCVARSLFGATAFPERETDSAGGPGAVQYHYLLALQCRNLNGCDTEQWQLDKNNDSNWRPGEKAFLGIPYTRVLAWTKLLRRPNATGSGWSFRFPETRWNWCNVPDDQGEAYLKAELSAWSANIWYDVPGKYDFAK